MRVHKTLFTIINMEMIWKDLLGTPMRSLFEEILL